MGSRLKAAAPGIIGLLLLSCSTCVKGWRSGLYGVNRLPKGSVIRASGRGSIHMQSVQEQFWSAVDAGLKQFDPNEIQRVHKFCKLSRKEAPLEIPDIPYYQPIEEHIEGLTAEPYPDSKAFPWVSGLEDSVHIIQEELQQALALQRQSYEFKSDSNVAQVMGSGWTALRLQRHGQWNAETCARFPRTVELLASLDMPFTVRGVMFARQAPGTGVQPHSDGRNFILTAHLGLQVPREGCWIRVGGERRRWEEGKVLMIDTTFEHETGNESNEDRYVLLLDVWHPEVSPAERQALRMIYSLRNKFEGRSQGEGLSGVPPLRPQKQPVGVGRGVMGVFKQMFGG